MPGTLVLDDLRLLAVSGGERSAFLQGQLTQDVTAARADSTILAGWAEPKGRLLFAGHLFAMDTARGEVLALLVPAELADALLKRLRMYVLRSKVELAVLDLPVTGLIGELPAGMPGPALRLAGDDQRYLIPGPAPAAVGPGGDSSLRSAWQLADIRCGLPVILPATSGEFVPQMVNLDLLGGISFTKGCYTGQEIVARMKYLGRVKRRMLHFASEGPPPDAGATLYAERGPVGRVVSSAPTDTGSELLAVIVLDDLPGPLSLDEARSRPLRQLPLPYPVPP